MWLIRCNLNIRGIVRLSAKTIGILVREADWNQNLHQGRGGVRVSYGPEYKAHQCDATV